MIISKEYCNPIGALIEITTSCNLNCSHCYNASGVEKENNDLSDESWEKHIEELLSKGMQRITFSGGEPLLRKKLICKLAKNFNAYPNTELTIITNGWYIDKSFIEVLKELPNKVSFQVSIDGADDFDHDFVRRKKDSWNRAVTACSLITSNGLDLSIAHTVNNRNEYKLENMYKLSIALGARTINISPAVPLGRGTVDEDSIILEVDDRYNIKSRVEKLKEKYLPFIETNIASPGGSIYYKDYLKYNQDWLLINPDGQVKLESRLPFLIGNIEEFSIDDLWQKVINGKKNNYIQEIINKCIENDTEIDNQEYIFL